MGELWPDSFPGPNEMPDDAVAVLCWKHSDSPPYWEVVVIGTGYATMPELAEAVGQRFPEMRDHVMLYARVGGTQGRIRRLRRSETTTVTVTEEAVV